MDGAGFLVLLAVAVVVVCLTMLATAGNRHSTQDDASAEYREAQRRTGEERQREAARAREAALRAASEYEVSRSAPTAPRVSRHEELTAAAQKLAMSSKDATRRPPSAAEVDPSITSLEPSHVAHLGITASAAIGEMRTIPKPYAADASVVHARNAGVVAIAVGARHGLALRGDGTVLAWGEAFGVPAGLAGVTAIAAGKSHSLALKSNGTVVAWGHNDQGQVDVPLGLAGVIAIAAGLGHSLALKEDGSVVGWGFNDAGQINVPHGLTGVKAIAAGWWHSLALRRDGSVVAWGHPDSDQRHVPQGLTGAVAIAAGYENSSAILADGTVVDWGNDTNFMGVPAEYHAVTAIAYGYRHRLALRRDGSVASDGYFFGGVPVPSDLTDVIAIDGGEAGASSHFLALKRDGSVVALGIPSLDDDPVLDLPAELTRPTDHKAEAAATHAQPINPTPAPSPALTSDQGHSALMAWAAIGDETKVRTLLHQGADVHELDEDGDGVLRYAMGSRNARVFEMLIESGADPDGASTTASGRAGFSVVHAVAEMGWGEGIQVLVRHGAGIDARGKDGITPLMLAAGAGWNSCVSQLQLAGADVDAVDDDGDSALFYAASKGHKTTVALLLELGVDADPSTGSGHSPLIAAAHLASPMSRERPANTPPSDYTRIVLDLVRAGADATAMYGSGYILQKQTSRGTESAPLARLRQLVADDNHWNVAFAPTGQRSGDEVS